MNGSVATRPIPFRYFRLLVIAVAAIFTGGLFAVAAPSPTNAAPADPVLYWEGSTLVESYADCVAYECPSAFPPPVMVDMPGTAGDLYSVPANSSGPVPTPGWTMTYTVNDARIAGVGTVTVTGRYAYSHDANPLVVELIWPFEFTDDEWPYTDACGTDDDAFTVPGDVSWSAPPSDFVPGAPSSVSIVYTVADGRVAGVGTVTVTAAITTNVGAGPVTTVQSYPYAFTNEPCGGPPVEPPPVEPPAPTQPPVNPPPVEPPTTTTAPPPPGIPATGADITTATIIGALGVLGGVIALGARRLHRFRS